MSVHSGISISDRIVDINKIPRGTNVKIHLFFTKKKSLILLNFFAVLPNNWNHKLNNIFTLLLLLLLQVWNHIERTYIDDICISMRAHCTRIFRSERHHCYNVVHDAFAASIGIEERVRKQKREMKKWIQAQFTFLLNYKLTVVEKRRIGWLLSNFE